ncbi:hypothetical protein l13_00020 [Neisseria weaveri ATCC 51223]|nr:hypothetical protein l13_00020 [Neisseria weaveri ATCC 51223]
MTKKSLNGDKTRAMLQLRKAVKDLESERFNTQPPEGG